MFKITLDIYPIADCGKDLSKGEPSTISYEGADLYQLQYYISDTLINVMRAFNCNDGETFIEIAIEKDGEYYDHDEVTVFVDFINNRVRYEL